MLFYVFLVWIATVASSPGDEIWNNRTLRLVLDETFDDELNTSVWEHEISLRGGGNWEFQAYTNLPWNSYTKDGTLYLKPTFTAHTYGEEFLTKGVWDMEEFYGKCSDDRDFGCSRQGKYNLLNPVLSAKLGSRIGIRYGKVEAIVKMPRGDWLWSAIWMLPNHENRIGSGVYGDWPRSGEIDIAESRGNRDYENLGIQRLGTTLHWGTDYKRNRYERTRTDTYAPSGDFGDGLHNHTFYWDETGMWFYVDDVLITSYLTPDEGFFEWGNLPGDNIWAHADNAPFDQEFFLILNVAIGGLNGFFPDSTENFGYPKPWQNKGDGSREKFWDAKCLWEQTWKGDDAAMHVESIKMWQLE